MFGNAFGDYEQKETSRPPSRKMRPRKRPRNYNAGAPRNASSDEVPDRKLSGLRRGDGIGSPPTEVQLASRVANSPMPSLRRSQDQSRRTRRLDSQGHD